MTARHYVCLFLLLGSAGALPATTIDFDNLSDGEFLTTQLPGLTFTNTEILRAGFSLNEQDFPPHSGSNVASDAGGPIEIAFDQPISSFQAYFTYSERLTLAGFDSSHDKLIQIVSAFQTNLGNGDGDPGSTPNELLSLQFPSGIDYITLAGGLAGGSFVMDDLAYVIASPEPLHLPALGSMLLMILFLIRFLPQTALQ